MADDYQIIDDSKVKFHDLYRGEEEDGLVSVGRQDIASYVSLPAEAVEVIDLLDSGMTVGEVKKTMENKYSEEVGIREFIEDMITNEMVQSIDGYEIATTSQQQKSLFSGITGRHVGWMFSKYAYAVYISMAVSCLIIFAAVPEYIPKPRDFFFHPWYSVAVGSIFLFGWILVAFHELAHLFAAKSVGIEGNFSLSNRLVYIVAQTNLGNIWTIPRRKRYIVYFAGMAWDTMIVFVCLILIIFNDQGILSLSALLYGFLKAVIFIKIWDIVWQFRFNMQTDIYYVVSNFLKCRSLLGDAKTFIRNILSKFCGRTREVDMSSNPEYEMRAIKLYTPFYFAGTLVTLATFFFRTIPLLFLRIARAYEGLVAGYATHPQIFMDAVALITLSALSYGLLGYVILRPRWNGLKQRFHAVVRKNFYGIMIFERIKIL